MRHKIGLWLCRRNLHKRPFLVSLGNPLRCSRCGCTGLLGDMQGHLF